MPAFLRSSLLCRVQCRVLYLVLFCVSVAILQAQKLQVVANDAAYRNVVAAHKGKVVLVEFWATWCVPCREEMPELVKLESKLRARGLDVIMISVDDPNDEARAAKVLKDTTMPVPGFLRNVPDDDKFCVSVDPGWASGAVPAIFLYDRSGKKARAFIGATPMKTVEAALEKLF
jgi:thiol-disulfide isomerase/thioredoxin